MLKKIRLFGQVFEHRDEIILRDYLALERTKLANERTFLAYLRTSLYMLLGGIAFLRLTDFESIRWVGYVSLVLSAILICIGVVRSYVIRRRLTRYYKINAMIAKSEREKEEK